MTTLNEALDMLDFDLVPERLRIKTACMDEISGWMQVDDDEDVAFGHEYISIAHLASAQEVQELINAALIASEAKLAEVLANQHYRYIGRNGKPVLARDLEDRAEAAEAKLAKMREALETVTKILDQCLFGYIRVDGQYLDRKDVVSSARTALQETGE